MAGQALLTGDAELAVRRTCREDQRESLVLLTVAKGDVLDIAVKLQIHNVVKNNLRAEPLGLGLDLDHEVWAEDAVREPRKILDLCCPDQLAAGFY